MAYTASALSFMLEDLGKPVVLTGAQVRLILNMYLILNFKCYCAYFSLKMLILHRISIQSKSTPSSKLLSDLEDSLP